MVLKKDKQKVLGEVFSDERVRGFLDFTPYTNINPDYQVLERAYRGMKSVNFTTFIKFFVEDKRDINALGPAGKTFLQIISEHRNSQHYISVLKAAGAK